MSTPRVPFTILTGFLGSGKTTVLNRVLGFEHDRRVAVLVNELGRVAIDSRLIINRGGDVLELAGGCVCCKIDVKNDLWDGIVDIIDRSKPHHVVLETTGIAEPDAIVDGVERLPAEARKKFSMAGVACVVDAQAALDHIDRREEVLAQIESADRFMLSKLDLVDAEQVRRVHERLAQLKPDTERAAFPQSAEGTAALVSWLLERRSPNPESSRRKRRHHDHHDHLHQVVAASFVDSAPLLREPLLEMVEGMREKLFRVKGYVNVAGEARRGYLELAGSNLELRLADDWGDATARTELVFIGDGLDESALRRQLWACRAA